MKIYTKLFEAQKKLKNVAKDADNPFFHSKYATLEAVLAEVKPVCNELEILIFQAHKQTESGLALITELIDPETGDKVSGEIVLPLVKQDPQAAGSMITYARRYALVTMFNLGTEDDDGNTASTTPTPSTQSPQGQVKFASDAQIGAISKMVKSGKLDESIANEIPGMTAKRAYELIAGAYGQ